MQIGGWPSGILGHLIWIMRLIRGGREAQTGSEWAGHWIRGLPERGSHSQHPRKIYEKQTETPPVKAMLYQDVAVF